MRGGRAVIIGSGLSGLSTALLLAEAGWQVDVLERHRQAGGLMQRYHRDACVFETGFHMATGGQPGGPLLAIMQRLLKEPLQGILAPQSDAQFIIHVPGKAAFAAPPGIHAVMRQAQQRWPQDAAAIACFESFLQGALAANPWLAGLAQDRPGRPLPREGMTLQAVFEHCGLSGDACSMLGAACAIIATRPESCPFDLYAAFAGSGFAGSIRLREGGDGLIRPLCQRLHRLGGRLHLGRGAQRIVHSERLAEKVIDQRGQEYPCDLVVAAIHPDETLRLTGSAGFRPSFIARLQELRESQGAVMLAAQLRQPCQELGASHHLLTATSMGDCYLVAPHEWDPEVPACLEMLAWIDVDALAPFRASRLGWRSPDYQDWKNQHKQEMLQILASHFPRTHAAIERVWMASPLTFRDFVGGRHGGAMGLSHDLDHGLESLPLSPRNKIRNLILTGHSIHHPGILGSLIGGCVSAGSILGQDLCKQIFQPQQELDSGRKS